MISLITMTGPAASETSARAVGAEDGPVICSLMHEPSTIMDAAMTAALRREIRIILNVGLRFLVGARTVAPGSTQKFTLRAANAGGPSSKRDNRRVKESRQSR